MMNDEDFERLLADMRPKLHRYCARMTGSTIDGEDIVQETLAKAVSARSSGAAIDSPSAWLFRVAHNASLDFLRRRARANIVPITEDAMTDTPRTDIAAYSFHTFLQLPELQRCAVILKDVLGHSVEEIAEIAECSPAAAKSALQRGRAALALLAKQPEDTRLPALSEEDRTRLCSFVELFRKGDFDAIRAMLADDVKLDLVARLQLQGSDKIGMYFTRYGEAPHWRFDLGAVDGEPVMLVFDSRTEAEKPSHYVRIDWSEGRILAIRDSLFAPYTMEAADWVRLN